MSTRSRANPWFRPVVPLAEAYLKGVVEDAALEAKLRPTVIPRPTNYEEHHGAMVRALVRSRLDNKMVLLARMLDPEYDQQVREICPDLAPLSRP